MNKIVCLIDNLGSGGAQRQMVNLAVLLKKEGYDIEFITYYNVNFFKYILDEAEISVNCMECSSPIKRIMRICSYLRKSDAKAVITFLETPGFLGCFAKAIGGNWKLITSERSANENSFVGFGHRIYNFFERYSDYKVCNSQNASEMWKRHYPKYSNKLRVIYNPVLIPENIRTQKCSEDNSERRQIVVAASFQKIKNPLGLIEAVSMLTEDERSKIQIDWYGQSEGSEENINAFKNANEKVNEWGLEGTVLLHGENKEIYQTMKKADAIGLFSVVEGLPNVICEAMTLGKPVIMTRVSDYQELTDGNGILCNPDPESIAGALRDFISLNQGQLEEMGSISATKAKKLFSPKEIVEQWKEVIE